MPCPCSRFLEHLRRALETGDDRGRQVDVALDLADGVDRLPERVARREIERNGHRRLLALMIDLQRPDRRHDFRDRGERNGRPGGRDAASDAAARRDRARRASPYPAVPVFRKILDSAAGSA